MFAIRVAESEEERSTVQGDRVVPLGGRPGEAGLDAPSGAEGELSIDDGPHLRLRDTVHEFLATGGSYAVTATHLTVHKNTVQYRLRKVEELLGYAVGAGHGELDLAIRACRHLGRAVMTTATTG